jgi:hypothetical protein
LLLFGQAKSKNIKKERYVLVYNRAINLKNLFDEYEIAARISLQ